MLTKNDKSKVIDKFKESKNDTGSSAVQISILTETIKYLTQHLDVHKKDIVARRSLLKKVGQRKRLLNYVKVKNYDKYKELITKLNLRK